MRLFSAARPCFIVTQASDPAFDGQTLCAGTYLTTLLDHSLTNTGFGAVGRYALPIPAPATHLYQYELPRGTSLGVGTVAPMFGQSGGGVEAKIRSIPIGSRVVQVGHLLISAC